MTTTTPSLTLSAVKRIRDDGEKARAAAELLARMQSRHAHEEEQVISVRDQACEGMLANGASFADVGRAIQRTRSHAAQRFDPEKKKRGSGS